MTSHKDTLAAALTDAGYPAPHTPDADQNKLTWCVGGNAPFIHVEDTGAVSVHCAGRCEAQFVLGPERQSAADWVALLHPQIAELIATASGGTPVPEPVPVVPRQAELVWLDHNTDSAGTYAVYTDDATVRVSDSNGLDSANALFGTVRGHQLGITSDTVIPLPSAAGEMVMVNPVVTVATAREVHGRWLPAVTFRDTRGFLDRAQALPGVDSEPRPTEVRDRKFRGFSAPTIALGEAGPFETERDAVGAAEMLLSNARKSALLQLCGDGQGIRKR